MSDFYSKEWDASCVTANTDDVRYMESLGLKSNIATAVQDKRFYYHRGMDYLRQDSHATVLILLHGYPQTNFMWRHIVPLLPEDIPLFILDLPGYGRSAPLSGSHDKKQLSRAVVSALSNLIPDAKSKVSVILAGHDRGARVSHRFAVDAPYDWPNLTVRGTILFDIVPTVVQYQSFATPSSSVSTWHWPFLANVDLATSMIKAQGGDVWVRHCIGNWSGKNEAGISKLQEHGALGIYGDFFKYDHVVRATCEDYRAGAFEDVDMQERDQKTGKKLDCDVLVMYSTKYLGSRYDVQKVWEKWMGKGKLETVGIDADVGHFALEEASEETAKAIADFYKAKAG